MDAILFMALVSILPIGAIVVMVKMHRRTLDSRPRVAIRPDNSGVKYVPFRMHSSYGNQRCRGCAEGCSECDGDVYGYDR